MVSRPLTAAALAALLVACASPPPEPVPPPGVHVSVETLESIPPGTDGSAVLALLGEPSERELRADTGEELWSWCCLTTDAEGRRVLLLVPSDPTPPQARARVLLREGRVVRVWVD